MMRYLPISLDLSGRETLVVGGSDAAARKARLLAAAGARVTVIAADPGRDMQTLAGQGVVQLEPRAFIDADMVGPAVVIVDTGDRTIDAAVAATGRIAGVPVNVIDAPDLSTFIMPAIVDRDPITVAISSAGTSPVLARQIRARIEAMLPANLGALARFAHRFRGAVAAVRKEGRTRRRFWERFFDGAIAARVLAGEEQRAQEQMLMAINRPDDGGVEGRVTIVGAGPGDPGLLTLKAARALQEADVIVHDRLVGAGVLDHARRDADRIYVGKAKGNHALTQAEINDLLVEKARAGLHVVRLKGGDPFIFGRGGEECSHLQAHGIAVETIPGITAALGCAAAAGIPLTHRQAAQAVTFVTGQGKDGEPELDWALFSGRRSTLVVYMGASVAGRITERLLAHGADPAMPVAVIVNGTQPRQRILTGRLTGLGALAAAAGEGPLLIIVGEVVRHAGAWRERAPELAVAG